MKALHKPLNVNKTAMSGAIEHCTRTETYNKRTPKKYIDGL